MGSAPHSTLTVTLPPVPMDFQAMAEEFILQYERLPVPEDNDLRRFRITGPGRRVKMFSHLLDERLRLAGLEGQDMTPSPGEGPSDEDTPE